MRVTKENNKNTDKRFDEWNDVKIVKHYENIPHSTKEGEVWWCAIGENIGIEINGKSETFSRPVLVMKKLSKQGFLGVPLTSKPHDGNWYAAFKFKDKMQYAALCQIRVFSVSRLYKKMGTIPCSDLQFVRDGFHKLYF